MGQDSTPEWRKATLSAMTYDQGRMQCANTGNVFFDLIGSRMGSSDESAQNWKRARELAQRDGVLTEFERIQNDWLNYEGPDD